jgi:purine-binding chemotaxis protein CheW
MFLGQKMKDIFYLIFNLHNVRYGIEASLVREIFLLPELIPITETPIDIIGVVNLRAKIIPIMHLDSRLGNPIQECKTSDSVIVLEQDELTIGLIVNNVEEVQSFSHSIIEKIPDYGRASSNNPLFIAGIVKAEDKSVILLNVQALIRQPDVVKEIIKEENLESNETTTERTSFYKSFCPNATPTDRAVFHQRASSLKKVNVDETSSVSGKEPIAILRLCGEYFGVDLDTVREFINIRSFTPIPCCPKHIVGNINLRGEVLTLVDIRGTLNLPMTGVNNSPKAVVIHADNMVAGLPVDEVLDVMYINSASINNVPIAVSSGSEGYIRGTITYREKILSIIDLPKLISKGGLEVNESF